MASKSDRTHDLPPALPVGAVRLVALGGIGEVGRNMTMFEYLAPGASASRLLVVDCGMLLGKTNSPGIDVTLPDWSFYRDRLADIDAVVLTHGHEDHIGALPYLLRERADIPVIGSRLTLALVAAKLAEHRIKPQLQQVRETEKTTVGDWGLEFFSVNHSIPDALAVAIHVGGQTLLHTGDFKMDQTPLDGRLTDLPGFSRLGNEGVDLLLADSTNAEVPGFNPSEQEVGKNVIDVITKAQGRIIVACFASHVHRVQQVLEGAVASRRKVALVGRSMVRNMGIARELGLLEVPDGLIIDMKQIGDYPPEQTLLICTGSQGEPLSALSRMANNEHPTITIHGDDTILLASSLIPGNENSVGQVINGLARLGASVIHKSMALVHVSGHAPAGELRYLHNAVRPKNLMPVHGEWRHLRAHAAIARSVGIDDEHIMIAPDGTVVDLLDGVASVVGTVPVGYVYVDGLAVGDISDGDGALKDRMILGEEGFISVLVAVDMLAGKVVFGPEISARGFSDDPHAFDPILKELVSVVETAVVEGTRDPEAIQRAIRRTMGRWVDKKYRRRPMLVPTVIEV